MKVLKFKKKPIEVEAVQVTQENTSEIMAFCGDKLKNSPFYGLIIETLEGEMIVNNGDWIIKGVKGEFYPCKPDIFEETYEPVVEPSMNWINEIDRRMLIVSQLTGQRADLIVLHPISAREFSKEVSFLRGNAIEEIATFYRGCKIITSVDVDQSEVFVR